MVFTGKNQETVALLNISVRKKSITNPSSTPAIIGVDIDFVNMALTPISVGANIF